MVKRATPLHVLLPDCGRQLEQLHECGCLDAQFEQQPDELEQQCGFPLRLFFQPSERDMRRVEKQGCMVLRYANPTSRTILVGNRRKSGAHP